MMEVSSVEDKHDEEIFYDDFILGDLIIKNVPYERVVIWRISQKTRDNMNRISEENHNDGRLNNKVVEYNGNNEK